MAQGTTKPQTFRLQQLGHRQSPNSDYIFKRSCWVFIFDSFRGDQANSATITSTRADYQNPGFSLILTRQKTASAHSIQTSSMSQESSEAVTFHYWHLSSHAQTSIPLCKRVSPATRDTDS